MRVCGEGGQVNSLNCHLSACSLVQHFFYFFFLWTRHVGQNHFLLGFSFSRRQVRWNCFIGHWSWAHSIMGPCFACLQLQIAGAALPVTAMVSASSEEVALLLAVTVFAKDFVYHFPTSSGNTPILKKVFDFSSTLAINEWSSSTRTTASSSGLQTTKSQYFASQTNICA